jgi:lysophospholipid acyltransferase (LPLAT)-like uncharacterized protein
MATPKIHRSVWIWLETLVIWLVVYVLAATIRMKILYQERLFEARKAGKPIVYAFWHGRQIALFKANPEKHIVVMASMSRDGELQARVCERFGVDAVRGSSSRRGLSAMLALGRLLADGISIGLAVDGPRGPVFTVKPGILALARVRGCPVVPITAGFKRKLELRSWDRFQIPAPFTRATVAYGVPLWIPADADANYLEDAAARLTQEMRKLTVEVDGLPLSV